MQKTPLYGLDRELAEKQAGKYDPEREQQAQRWIEAVLKEPVFAPGVDLHAGLKDGLVLGRLMNAIVPGSCRSVPTSMAFKQMENINAFLVASETVLGVPRSDLFQTVDLFERKNPNQVVDALFAVARHAQKKASWIPALGPRLADKHAVAFSDEQLNAGKYLPTQQSGYHAALNAQATGATASGISIGAQRQISNASVETGDKGSVSQQTGKQAAANATASGIIYGARREIGGVDLGRSKSNEQLR